MKKIPLIAIVTGATKKDDKVFATLNMDYINAVYEAEGAPYMVVALENFHNYVESILEKADGILFAGGGDIEPSLYNEKKDPRCNEPDFLRDEFELALCSCALKRNIPILGICRGLQILSVVTGGKLLQHVEGHGMYNTPDNEVQIAKIDPKSKLAKIIGEEEIGINSRHHQVVAVENKYLKAVAFCSEDNIIEAMEHREKAFAIGVQWHPESLYKKNERHKKLFTAFVEECKGK